MNKENNVSFIPDLPSGPLDEYRKKATFNWKIMKTITVDPKKIKLQMEIWETLEKDPLFQHTPNTLPVDEFKRLTALRVQRFFQFQFLQLETLGSLPSTSRTRQMMIINEALVQVFPDVSIKIGLSYSLFLNALQNLGSERHANFVEASKKGQIIGSFALTEIAHGSNTKNMMTSATYDKKTQEFVINTPCFESAKCYVGNLGKSCTVALLLAQLYTEGECKGLHVFVVPIRDPKTMLPYPGIIIGDIGEKGGINGVDNGFILFNHYRIPREYLLNRTANVTPEGVYESSFTDPARILGAALEMLSAARVAIIQENTCLIANAVTIAIRYAALRKQFQGDNGKEVPIIEYPLHQLRLFPYVAASYVFRFFNETLTDLYLTAIENSNSDIKIDNLSDIVSEIHALVSSSKPLITWTCRDAIQECREACGGFGYLKASNLCDMRNTQDPSVTYEGDNNVLSQQTSKWLLRQWASVQNGCEQVASPIGTCNFFNKGKEILRRTFSGNTLEDVCNIKFIFDSFEWLICWLASVTNEEISRQGNSRVSSIVCRTRMLPNIYAENVALNYHWSKIQQNLYDPASIRVLEQFGLLYGLWCLDKHLIYFYEGGYANSPNLAKLVKEAILKLCFELKPNAVAAVDALASPDYVLNSIIAKSDGQLYNNIQTEFFHNNSSMSRVSWWKDIANIDAPDFRKCKL